MNKDNFYDQLEEYYILECIEGKYEGMKALFKRGTYLGDPGLILVQEIEYGKDNNSFCSHCIEVVKEGVKGNIKTYRVSKEDYPELFL